jgi:hypothetical protein
LKDISTAVEELALNVTLFSPGSNVHHVDELVSLLYIEVVPDCKIDLS